MLQCNWTHALQLLNQCTNKIKKKKKMDGDLNRHQRHTANQQTHAKMLNINNHQENATQNHKENFPGAEAVKTLHSQ